MKYRSCQADLEHIFIDLGYAPLSNSFLTQQDIDQGNGEISYPLKVWFCDACYLVQLDEFQRSQDIFNENYVYFSSYSKSWLSHARTYVEMAIERFGLNEDSFVVEIASNDGYLLQYFQEKGIPCLGVEPSSRTAQVAKDKGIHTTEEFFSCDFAQRHLADRKADLILGNNVLAHVPDINDFVSAAAQSIHQGGGTVILLLNSLIYLIWCSKVNLTQFIMNIFRIFRYMRCFRFLQDMVYDFLMWRNYPHMGVAYAYF